MTDPIDFNKEKAKRKQAKADKGERISKTELAYQIVCKMNRHPLAPPDWPRFPRRFHYVADRQGRKAVIEEHGDSLVTYLDRDVVADAIMQYCWNSIPFVFGASSYSWRDATACRDMWLALTEPLIENPRSLAEKSESGLTFKRLPFDAPPNANVAPKHFEELLSRFSKPRAVCAFVGSLFYPEADRQQYLFLYGTGGDGKGTFMRFLQSIFGDAAQALSPPGRDGDKFWNFSLLGKRLGLFFDTDASDWFRKAHFKSLTGGDPQWFEEKGRMGFTAMPTVKFIVSSNFKPQVSGSPADMRRLIYVECKPVPGDQRRRGFEDVLLGEAQEIMSACKAIYLEECPSHGPIPCETATKVALETESSYLDVFHQFFELGDAAVPGYTVQHLLKKAGVRSNAETAKAKEVWQRELGIRVEHSREGTVYRGMGLLSKSVTDVKDGEEW